MNVRASVLLPICLLLVAAMSAQAQAPLTNEDILTMVQAGFGEGTIIKAIEANEPAYDTSVQALVELKKAEVTEKIIGAMLDAQIKKNGPADPVASRAEKDSTSTASTPELKKMEGRGQELGPTLPAIYVEEVSSDGTISASSDTTLECMKTLRKHGMRVVTIREKADYILQVTRQLGKKSWRKDTKVVLSNRDGEVVLAKSTRSVGGAMGDVKDYIKKHHL